MLFCLTKVNLQNDKTKKMKIKILLILCLSAVTINSSFGQKSNKKITITGVVTDANHNPVREAMILVDGQEDQQCY